LLNLRKSEPAAYNKAAQLIEELKQHPFTGTGKPEQLKGTKRPTWSRRITHKHRLVYEVTAATVSAFVITVQGHYDDK
jgi:toxin YoeB